VDEATRTLRLTGSASLPMVSPHVYTPNYIRCGVSDGPSSYYGATSVSGQSTVIKVRHADLAVEAFTDLRDTGTAHTPTLVPFCVSRLFVYSCWKKEEPLARDGSFQN